MNARANLHLSGQPNTFVAQGCRRHRGHQGCLLRGVLVREEGGQGAGGRVAGPQAVCRLEGALCFFKKVLNDKRLHWPIVTRVHAPDRSAVAISSPSAPPAGKRQKSTGPIDLRLHASAEALLIAVGIGLGRIVTLYCRSSAPGYQIR